MYRVTGLCDYLGSRDSFFFFFCGSHIHEYILVSECNVVSSDSNGEKKHGPFFCYLLVIPN